MAHTFVFQFQLSHDAADSMGASESLLLPPSSFSASLLSLLSATSVVAAEYSTTAPALPAAPRFAAAAARAGRRTGVGGAVDPGSCAGKWSWSFPGLPSAPAPFLGCKYGTVWVFSPSCSPTDCCALGSQPFQGAASSCAVSPNT